MTARTVYFISHPDVEISATVPVTQWPLSSTGRRRMEAMLTRDWVKELAVVYCSGEQKAIDGAEILSSYTGLRYQQVEALGENDRSSTGFLEPGEFEIAADWFFNNPKESMKGWETAIAAQSRIVEAVATIDREDSSEGSIAIVSHGAVGTLLYCYLTDRAISRRWDQPGSGGGNYLKLRFGASPQCSWWKPIDADTSIAIE